MNSIVAYPSTAQQFSLVQSFMEKAKVRFTVQEEKKKDDALFTKDEYYAMLDESIKQYEAGNYKRIRNKQELHQFLENL